MDMQIDFLARGVSSDAEPVLREFALRRLSFAVRRFTGRIRRVLVRLVDVNGPRRGVDSQSTITADLGLTAREFEVLEQLAFGHSDKRIAEELYISRKTVSVHVSNILRKLDVPDRVAAAQVAHELGMGSPG